MTEKFTGIEPRKVHHVTCIGAGPIGAGWSAWFLARGYKVTAYLHDLAAEETSLLSLIDTAWVSLEALGLAPGASRDNLFCTSDLAKSVAGAEFVQECAPEDLELVPTNVVIASSTSGLPMTDIQARCPSPQRTVVGHPFNPPYLLPLVEVVGGAKTDPEAVKWIVDFYRIAGKAPLALSREIPGFIATRLRGAKSCTWSPMMRRPWSKSISPSSTARDHAGQ